MTGSVHLGVRPTRSSRPESPRRAWSSVSARMTRTGGHLLSLHERQLPAARRRSPARRASASNRIRGPLTQIHPGLETVIGPHLDHPAVLALLAKYPTPKALKHAGKHRRSEEHTSELQSRFDLVCRLLLEKKK